MSNAQQSIRLIGVSFLFLLSLSAQCQWEIIGGNDTYFVPDGSSSMVQNLEFHPTTQEPYVFFREHIVNEGTGVSFMKHNGTAWEEISMMFDVTDLISSDIFDFYFRDNGTPVVCYEQSFYDTEVGGYVDYSRVVERIGTEWLEIMGVDNIPIDDHYFGATEMRMLPHPQSTDPVLVGSSENTSINGTTTLVTYFNNGVWEYLGDDDFGAFRGNTYDMDYNYTTGHPYVATFGDFADGDPQIMEVWTFNGDWQSLGDPGFTLIPLTDFRLRVSPVNGDVFVMAEENYDNPDNGQVVTLRVSKWNGSSWELLGTPDEVFAQNTVGYDLEIHPVSGEPYICFKDGNAPGNPGMINIKRWDGSAWLNLDDSDSPMSYGDGLDLEFQPGTNYPYIISNNGHLIRFVPTSTNALEQEKDQPFQVYPNPATNLVTFSETLDVVEVYNSKGQQVLHLLNAKSMDIRSLESGLYYIRSQHPNGSLITEEFVKL